MDLAFGAVQNTAPLPGTKQYAIPSIPLSEQTVPRPQPPADWEPWKIWAPGTRSHGMTRSGINPADWIKQKGTWVHVSSLPKVASANATSAEYQAAKIADAQKSQALASAESSRKVMLLALIAVFALVVVMRRSHER